MGFFKKLLWPAALAIFFTALARGFLLWLEESHQIFVDRHVATMIGVAELMVVQAPAWVGWTLAGMFGVVSMAGWQWFTLPRLRTNRRIPDTLVPLSGDDYKKWSKVDPLALWQAASLWAEFNPHLDIVRFDSTGYARFSMLLRAVETKTLRVAQAHDDTKFCHITREELKRYAETIGERPKFLFHPSIVNGKRLESKLDITGPFRHILDDSTVEKINWVFLVGVRNASSQEITKCEPRILVSDSNGNEFFGGEHPLRVNGRPINNFDLSPHQNKEIRVASFHPNVAGARIHINLAEGRWTNDLPTTTDYRVRIRVYARETTPAERDFKMFYDNEGLKFVDITKPGGLED